MKKRIMKSLCAMMAVCMLFATQITNVFAADDAASITIQGNEGQSLKDKVWEIHKLFYAENAEDGESVRYTVNEVYLACLQEVVAARINKDADEVTEYEILDCMQKMNHTAAQKVESAYSEYRYFMEELLVQIGDRQIEGILFSVDEEPQNNQVVIDGLEYGYYVLEDVSDVDSLHAAASMAIVTTANPTAFVNIKSDYPTVTKKIYEEDNGVGWNDVADYEIGEAVPFKYTSNIPNINGYDSYYYAWHDVMDQALTLQEDSIQIQITGTLNGADKNYTLDSAEYELELAPDNSDTFQIIITNIKEIIDREFDQITDGENVYGQTVTVTYEAVLNENAKQDTGRPGYENDVRLEFSNNPNQTEGGDTTGFTPWDTTACFTYRLDGLKINDKNAVLANAKFKIYRDEACSEEVFQEEYVSNDKGEFVICGLDSGTYYLKEVEAPAGYRPIDEPIKIEIASSFSNDRDQYEKGDGAEESMFELEGMATITTFEDGAEKTAEAVLETNAEEGSLMLKITNRIGNKLPITGSYMMPVLFAVGGVCVYLGTRNDKQKSK